MHDSGGKTLTTALRYDLTGSDCDAPGQPLSWSWAFASSTGPRLPAQRLYNTAGQLTTAEFATFAPESTGRIGSVAQLLMKSHGSGGWVEEEVPFNALYNSLGQLTSFQPVGVSPVFQWGHTYTYDNNANRTGGTITANGALMSFTSALSSNRLTNAAGITVVSSTFTPSAPSHTAASAPAARAAPQTP